MSRLARIALVAGEASGDLLASHLIAALKTRLPDARYFGIGGPRMLEQGFETWWPMEKLAVMGYVEVLRRFREIIGIRRQLKRRLLQDLPDLFIGVDAPDFNLSLEADLKAKGMTTLHYVSPSIWAWRAGRIRKIARAANRVLALFPMEPPLYQAAGIPVTYVGHPLADRIPMVTDKEAVRRRLGLPRDIPIFALLPGSRQSELEYMADTFVETALHLWSRQNHAQFVVPLATRETRLLFEAAMFRRQNRFPTALRAFRLMFGHAQDAIGAADAALVASGTATLETMLVKRPMVITYKLAPLTWKLMKHRARLPYVGLPNILSGQALVPEILQDDATPERLAEALWREMTDTERQDRLTGEFTRLHIALRQNTAEKAAAAVLACLPSR
ncbi:MAG: lipid-A-disaccharide synthase [Zoogloeaceae bacterium]|jgi:lipid-A-disaccharide synthase|nr:lipid-A-disaccharide synthase [Zoogloeaceae bacterium]